MELIFRPLSCYYVHATLPSCKLRPPLSNIKLGKRQKILNNVCVAETVRLTMDHDNWGWAGDPDPIALLGCAQICCCVTMVTLEQLSCQCCVSNPAPQTQQDTFTNPKNKPPSSVFLEETLEDKVWKAFVTTHKGD